MDSTPGIAHNDQLAIIIRYVRDNSKIVTYISIGQQTKDIEDDLLKSFENNGLNIMNCRGQSYDNATNMSGLYSGLQSRIKATNLLAHYVPCATHSLNLVETL